MSWRRCVDKDIRPNLVKRQDARSPLTTIAPTVRVEQAADEDKACNIDVAATTAEAARAKE